MLINSFEENLNYFRPFDIRGKCLIWKVDDKKLTFSNITAENCDIVFDQVKKKLLEISQ